MIRPGLRHPVNRRSEQATEIASSIKRLGLLCLADGTNPARLRDLAVVESVMIRFAASITAPDIPTAAPTPTATRKPRQGQAPRKGTPK